MSTAPNDPGINPAVPPAKAGNGTGNGLEQTADAGKMPVSQSFRGPLRYEVETSSTQIEAGKSFSIFIKITNPYDLPVRIISAKTKVPVEFMDAEEHVVSLWQAIKDATARERRREERRQQQQQQRTKRERVVSAVNVGTGDGGPAQGGDEEWAILQPGNSGLYEFKLCTRQVIFFTPSLYNLHIQIQYEMGGAVNHDAVKHQLNIRAPLKALVSGAVAGAYVGTLLSMLIKFKSVTIHLIKWPPPQDFLIALVSSVLLGAVIVIAFARKKDAQPFLSIEDFYGGFFMGFLAAYVGPPLLNGLLKGVPGAA